MVQASKDLNLEKIKKKGIKMDAGRYEN